MAERILGANQLAGQVLGHYLVVEKIGAGGGGEVYRARDQRLARDVAVKILPYGTVIDESARKHIRKEALILSQINHPNVTTIHDFDTYQGIDFLVMEYIPGITLNEKLATGSLPEKQVVALGIQLAEGLSAAHQHSIVHRDLKPGNIRLTSDGRLKILDFGLAKLKEFVLARHISETISETQTMEGTLPYMAPEQILGGEIDARTDIHAAGAVLYEMATGQRAFAPVERSQLTSAILRSSPRPPAAVNPSISSELSRIVEKCLEKEPENRYQSAKELAVDLKRLAQATESKRLLPPPLARAVLARTLRNRPVVALMCGIAVVLLLFGTLRVAHLLKPSPTARVMPSIAVLPFADLSKEKDQEYFSDGLAEELLNRLVKVQGLRVAAWTSSSQFKGPTEDLERIGQKLHVANVLVGSVRKQGQRVRISVQLVQVSDGFHLWSDIYDRDLTDIFGVQEDIAGAVVGALKGKLLGQKLPSLRTTNIEAYNAYLQGKYLYARPTKENLEQAIEYFNQAVLVDPRYAPAWAALSKAYSIQAGAYDPLRLKEGYGKARDAAERALEADPGLAEAHAALGQIEQFYDWDWAGADASYQRALASEPGNAEVLQSAASMAATLNDFEQALVLSRRAVELDPLRASAHQGLAFNAWWAGRLDEAEAAARNGLEVDPQFPWLHSVLGRVYLARSHPEDTVTEAERDSTPEFRLQALALAYHALGRKPDSDRALEELIAKYQKDSAFQIAEVYAYRGETDAAFRWLDRAYAQRDGGLAFAKGDPLMASLVSDSRYETFLRKMRLVT